MKKILAVSTDNKLLDKLTAGLVYLDFELYRLTEPDALFEEIEQTKPDMLIIDFILNDSNGGAICHQVKCNPATQNLPVIILSEYDNIGRLAQKFGSDAVVKKQVTISYLLEQVLDVLGASVQPKLAF